MGTFGVYGNDYRQVQAWQKERVHASEAGIVLFAEVYADYVAWSHGSKFVHSEKAVRMVLKALGAGHYRKGGRRYVTGITLVASNVP